MRRALTVIAGLLLVEGAARAGRRPFLYAQDAATVPEGDVELETWFDLVSQKVAETPDLWRFWWGPRFAPIDGVEVVALVSLQQPENADAVGLWAGLLEGRWRSAPAPAGSLMLQLDLRLGLDPALPHQIQPQVGWTHASGRFVQSAQVGYAHGFGHANYDWLTWRAGAAVDVIRGEISAPLQLGIESFGELMLTSTSNNDFRTGPSSVALLGPTLSVARGRLWLSVGVLLGLSDKSPSSFVRSIIGVAL